MKPEFLENRLSDSRTLLKDRNELHERVSFENLIIF
jgi:hypothetical protein